MRSPETMLHIQIDITNACNKRCSNCTRFCGNHKKTFNMNYDTFTRAVDSLEGFGGTYGIIGGEPTLHPEFERFVNYVASKFNKFKSLEQLIYPQNDFIRMIHQFEYQNRGEMDVNGETLFRTNGPGLWSNMGASYKKYYETISDNFCVQYLNDHMNPSFHQPGLFARKDLGISDEEWLILRDNCWIQNEWSATITPKGAFFCEVAGALDMLFDGPGGWAIEPGWWKRKPDEFGEQLKWCEICGFALNTFTRDSDEEIDDVSPTLYEMLRKIDSPKLKNGRINVVKINNGVIAEESTKENKRFSPGMPYIEHYEDRFNALNSVLFTREFAFATIPNGEKFGIEFNKLLQSGKDWFVLTSENVQLSEDFSEKMSKYVLNPGTLHYLDLSKSNDTAFVKNADTEQSGYAALFSKNALSLRDFGFDRIAHVKNFDEILAMWQPNKIVELSSKIDSANKRLQICEGVRYAIWGTGSAGSAAVDMITSAGGIIAFALDKNEARQGNDFYGTIIKSPQILTGKDNEYDVLLAANYTRFPEIKREALALGVPKDKIKFINSLSENDDVIKSEFITWTNCPICKSKDIFPIEDGLIARCHDCGHAFRVTVPSVKQTVKTQYRNKKYWAQDKNHQGITKIAYSEEWSSWVNSRLETLTKLELLNTDNPGKFSIFEFGCSEGMLLYALKERDFDVLGNDVCEITEESQQTLGIKILSEPIENVNLDRQFDLVMSFHTLEHLVDPVFVMSKLYEICAPGGHILVHIPIDDGEFGNLDHYHFFTRNSLNYLMNKLSDIRTDEAFYRVARGDTLSSLTIIGRKN